MNIGCLKLLGELWPRTTRNLQEIQTIARHILGIEESRSTNSSHTSSNNSALDLSNNQKQISFRSEAESWSNNTDLSPPLNSFEDLCGLYNRNEIGQDPFWLTNNQLL